MNRGARVLAALAALVVTTATAQSVAPRGADAAVPCSVSDGFLTDKIDLLPGQSATRTYNPIPPDNRADLTIADLDVFFAFTDYVAGPRIFIDHAGRRVQLMGQYDTSLKPTFDITFDDEAPTPLGQESPSGRYQPPSGFVPLAEFDRTSYGGSYTLTVDNLTGAAVHIRDWRLVITPNTCDSDGDGVEEKVDNCPTVANADQTDWDGDRVGNACDVTPGTAPVPPGTGTPTCTTGCAYVRTVGMRQQVRKHRLVGKVESTAVGCRREVPVTIWRTRPGADRKLVVVTTRRTGSYHTRAPRKAGRYYASVGSAAEPLCGNDTSRVVRVRR